MTVSTMNRNHDSLPIWFISERIWRGEHRWSFSAQIFRAVPNCDCVKNCVISAPGVRPLRLRLWGWSLRGGYTGIKLFIDSKVQCFVLKFALQKAAEGEKREGIQISKQGTQNLWPKKRFQPFTEPIGEWDCCARAVSGRTDVTGNEVGRRVRKENWVFFSLRRSTISYHFSSVVFAFKLF